MTAKHHPRFMFIDASVLMLRKLERLWNELYKKGLLKSAEILYSKKNHDWILQEENDSNKVENVWGLMKAKNSRKHFNKKKFHSFTPKYLEVAFSYYKYVTPFLVVGRAKKIKSNLWVNMNI